MFLKKRTFFKTIFIPSIERIKFHRGFIYFKRVRLIKYDIYSWTNYSKNFCAKVDYKPILNISLTDSIDWKSAIRNLRTPERKYSARIKAIKIRTKEKQSKSFKESTVSGSLSNTRDPGNNGFIHQEFPCRIDHYNAILHLRTVPNKIPNDSYFMYLKANYYLMTREQRPIYNITGIPVQVCFQVNVYFYNVDLHARH